MFLKTLFAVVLFSAVASAAKLEVQSLKRAIQNSNATWQAKENHLSDYSVEELRRMMGYHEAQPDMTFLPTTVEMKAAETIVDWRNHNGQNWVSPILDQGNCGSCVAFATVATLETQANITRQLPWLNPKYSPQALFACGGGSCDSGWYPAAAANFLKTTGVPDEACAPYSSGATGQDASCSSVCANSASRTQKISSYQTLYGADQVKQALTKGPVVTTLTVYADFVLYSSGIYKHTTGSALGGHAVSLIGYNDTDRYWIIRNSWAQDWGEKGFAKVSYDDDSGVGNQGWALNLPNAAGAVGLTNLNDRDYRSGTFKLSASSSFANTTGLVLNLTLPNGQVQTQTCVGQSCDFIVDSTGMADGLYREVVKAKSDMSTIGQSEEKYFYVVNKAPSQVKLSFTGKGIDLTQPLKGRVEFVVDAKTSPVPFTELEFIVSQNGKIIKDKISKNIAANTILGWRTPSVPNGQYQIQLLGKFVIGDKEEYTHDGGTFTITVRN